MNICLRVREKKCLHIATSNLDPPHSTDGFQHMLKLLKRSSTASKERWVGWRVAHPRNVWGPCWLIWKNEVFVSMQKKTILAIRLFKNEIRIFESRTPCSPKTAWVTQPDRDRQRSSWRTHGAALPDATDWLLIQLSTTSLSDFGQWLQILRKTISSIGLMLWKSRPGRGSTWRPAETDGACLEAPGAWQTDKVHRNSKIYVVNI